MYCLVVFRHCNVLLMCRLTMETTSSEESLISIENTDSDRHEDHGDSSSPDLVRILESDMNDIVVSRRYIYISIYYADTPIKFFFGQ